MEIKTTAVAGTLESSDIQIMISKGSDGIKINLESEVKKAYGDRIEKVITGNISNRQDNVREIMIYDVPATWSLHQILTHLKNWVLLFN